jgi:mRNA-degrading endonuclease RelE of RelBE toxin-antitoxin system
MGASFRIVAPNSFSRSLKKLAGRRPEIVDLYQVALEALEADPSNLTRRRHVKKLTGVAMGDGRWRIRLGNYRLRYDIDG